MAIVINGPAALNTLKDHSLNVDLTQYVNTGGAAVTYSLVSSTEPGLSVSAAGMLTGSIKTCGGHSVTWRVDDNATTDFAEETTPLPTYAPSGWPVGFLGMLS